ncbi:M48 family metalloprotease [Porticoccaceae bacterium]|nr:M48 family metalloprotease [Porticoccaceae bacterium]
MRNGFVALAVSLIIAGCSVNPVTGKSQLSFISPQQEVAIGEKNYAPSRQSQGGDYYLDPALQTYIRGVGKKLAAISDRPDLPYEFIVLNNRVPNAWALPGGKIAINVGLLVLLEDEAQLAAVLGHEIVHAAARHGATQITTGTLANIGVAAVGVAVQGQPGEQLYGMASQLGSAAWMAKYGRDDELESDYYGMGYMAKAGYEVQGAVELQETFVELSKSREADFFSGLFASHPPSAQRVAANKLRVGDFASGQRYRQRYQQAIAQLTADAPAYAAEKLATQALADEEPALAIKHLDKAVALQSAEAQFWLLRGQAWTMLEKPGNAEKSYTTAIAKNDGLFSPYLARGIVRYKQGKKSAAEIDLRRSYTLLPTAAASYYLGELALDSKQYQQAQSYFQQAAQDRGELGNQSRAKIQQVNLQLQPHTFLAFSQAVSSKGALLVTVVNTSSRAMRSIVLMIEGPLGQNGQSQTRIINLSEDLQSGQQLTINTGLNYFLPDQQVARFRIAAQSAKLIE